METLYVWIVEDQPQVGTLADYAKSWCNAHYSGIGVSYHVWKVEHASILSYPVVFSYDGTDDNDYMHYTLSVHGDIPVHATIDGRA